MFYLNSDPDTLHNTINGDLKEVCNWFECNKLSLNASKTNLLFIGIPQQNKQANNKRHIYLDRCKLTHTPKA